MDSEVKRNILKIIDELPDENSCLDYKAIPYENSKMHELIKDINAFLNSEEAYERDKYIIIGVSDSKDVCGLKSTKMLDTFYQKAADFIFPRPSIETGTIKNKILGREYEFGYIYISKENKDRVYEIHKDYYYSNDKNLYLLNQALPNIAVASTAWIRRGTCKRILDEHTRRNIYESNKLKIDFSLSPNINYSKIDASFNCKIIKTVILFGGWNENNEEDKKVLEEYIGVSYKEFIEKFRTIVKFENNFTFKNGVWKINTRSEYLKRYALDFYKEDFEMFHLLIIKILKINHPKLDLAKDKRNMYDIYNKKTIYSNEIRTGVAESLVILESLKKEFDNCKTEVSNFVVLTVREILGDSNWYIWASLNNLLPFLAESSPTEFLNQLEKYLLKDKAKKILFENELDITNYNYSTPLYWSLQLIAWNTDYFVRVGMILYELAVVDDKAIEHIVNILLPWYPNTFAPIALRTVLLENIFKKNISIGWKISIQLMPGIKTTTFPTYKPKYIDIPNEEVSISEQEYYEQVDTYIDLMLKYCKGSIGRMIDLISLLDKISRKNLDKICDYFKLNKNKLKTKKSKYKFWDKMKQFAFEIDKNETLKEEYILGTKEKIDEIIVFLDLNNIIFEVSRLFKKNNWELISDFENYSDSEKKLYELQLTKVKQLWLKKGNDSILELLSYAEDTFQVGKIFSNLNISIKDEKNLILFNLDKKEQLSNFSKGYIFNKYNLCNKEYDIYTLIELSKKSKINFLLMLPYNMDTFINVEKILINDSLLYWKEVNIRIIEDVEVLKYCVNKLLEVKRFEKILWLYRISIYHNKELTYDDELILTCLEKLNENFNQYDICEAISKLQKMQTDKERLFYIEWKFLPFLYSGENWPITIEKAIATDVNKYAEILKLAFKERSKEKDEINNDENIAKNAYNFLHHWKYIPGTKSDGYIDHSFLKQWYNDMKMICSEIDRLEVGLLCFGKLLFSSPKDKSGFWIDKAVARIIEENMTVRRGYETEAFNSVGVINWDENGTAYLQKKDEYEKKANNTDLEGYHKFATSLRGISKNFDFHAEHMKDTYYDN